METEQKLLMVGDEIVSRKYGKYGDILKITRVTAKRAFARVNEKYERSFYRAISGNFVQEYGGSSYGPSYSLLNDDIRNDVRLNFLGRQLKDRLNTLNIGLLSLDQLESLSVEIERWEAEIESLKTK